ncbi:pilus assembly protein [Streptomyces sp. SID4946]|uniref:TadE/TadG family type IV pilus assembly protein n=1 Tax=Streptomyces sp. LamerLS-31b TaxID=1839765 RepID=UPI00081D717E|nr:MULTISPECIES: TadE/TadG family type IV pilus assembly protein [unclassified Streptomyces]MYQ90250.1 pilus assembly protein [Streptomyces sp. SID4946]SCF57445.1 TadE-like protein [Streptomyces sp. LamerLS-31b]SCF59210.1 TadE-like protein [Streptomyces sp. DconLS]
MRYPSGRRDRRERCERGQVAIEYLGFLPVLLIVALAGIQLGAVAYAAEQAATAARAGARAASLRQDAQQACAAAVGGGMRVSCAEGGGGGSVTVTATVRIPKIVWSFGDATKSATMPLDH